MKIKKKHCLLTDEDKEELSVDTDAKRKAKPFAFNSTTLPHPPATNWSLPHHTTHPVRGEELMKRLRFTLQSPQLPHKAQSVLTLLLVCSSV